MASKNKQDRSTIFSVRNYLLHPALLFLFAATAIIGGSISLWARYQDKIVDIAEYQLNADSIRLNTPVPTWADADLKSMLLDHFKSSSILEPSLVPRTAELIRSIGWVESINQIQKSKSGLEIDLTYREPIAMVKTAEDQLLPIDRLGVVFDPKMISQEHASNLLTVSIFRPIAPNVSLQTWQKWPDRRIEGAAAIGEALGAHWKPQGLYRIVTRQMPGDRAEPQPFELWTYGHFHPYSIDKRPYAAKVLWGNPPGMEAADEASANAKIRAIDEFIVQRGPLVESIPQGKMLDVRSGKPILTPNLRAAEKENLFSEVR